MRVEDVLPAVVDALSDIRLSRQDRQTVTRIMRAFDACCGDVDAVDPETGESYQQGFETDLYETLWDLAQSYCPDYCHFGSHPGDGADVGVWPVEELFVDSRQGSYDGYVYRLDDQPNGEIPVEYTHALTVNDRGNATLYRRAGRRWVGVWSVV
jgi:hypothetical protein